jgi:hypothetical protein
MNPYLENPQLWPKVHSRLIVAMADALNPQLMPKYRAAIDQRVYDRFIDLLRQGEPMALTTGNVQSHYRILVSRAEQRPQADLYAFSVQDSMPQFPLPLAPDEVEPIIDLQGLLNQVYDRAGYDMVIDYARPPVPPLEEADAAWADELLHPGD